MTLKVKKGESFKKGDPVYWDSGSSIATQRNLGTVLKGTAESDSKNGEVKIKSEKSRQ